MRRDRELWRRCRLWLVLILGLVIPAAAVAQAPGEYDEEAEEYGGMLHLRFDRSGEAELSIWMNDEKESAELRKRLQRALHCRIEPPGPPGGDEEEMGSVQGRCASLLRREGSLFHGRLDLNAVTSSLGPAERSRFGVSVVLPRTPSTRCEGWTRAPYSFNDEVHCSPEFKEAKSSVALPAVNISYGYRPIDVLWKVAVLGALAFLPLGLMWPRRKRMLAAAGKDEQQAAWFAYWRAFRAVHQGGWMLWIAAFFTLRFNEWLEFLLPGTMVRMVMAGALLVGVPSVVFLVSHALSHTIMTRVRELTLSRKEAVGEAVGTLLFGLVPLPLVILGWASLGGDIAIWWYFGTAVLSMILGRLILVRTLRQLPHAIALGELRDRVFALAQKVRVKLQGVYVLPAARQRMANAFATSGNNVILTDYLLQNLTRREAEAVVAHEIAHLRYRHPVLLVLGLWAVGGGLWMASSFLGLFFGLNDWTGRWAAITDSVSFFPLLLLAGLLPFWAMSRRAERSADAYAGMLTGHPEALISALGKLSRLSLLPVRWGNIQEAMSTHPDMQRRGEALALRFGIPYDRMLQLLHGDPAAVEEGEPYELPVSVLDQERVFTTPFKARASVIVGWSTLLLSLALCLAAAIRMERTGGMGWLAVAAAVAFISLARVAVLNFLAPVGYSGVRQRLASRLAGDEVAAGGVFCGFSPHEEPRLYEGHTVWDVGFLLLGSDALVYRGDQADFRLRREQITGVRRGRAFPSWLPISHICVDWRADDGMLHTFRICLQARTLLGIRRLAGRFARTLADWYRTGQGGAELPASAAALPPPPTIAVTGQAPREALQWLPMLNLLWLEAVVIAAAGLLLEATSAILPAIFLAVLVLLVHLVPVFFYRETKTGTRLEEQVVQG